MDIVERAKKLGLHDCNLHQMFGRVEELQQQLAEANSFIETLANTCEIAERRALECQARDKVLRDAVEESMLVCRTHGIAFPGSCLHAMRQPTDDTALKAALAKERDVIYQFVGRDFAHLEPREALEEWFASALKAERERIATHFDGKDEMFGDSIADAIRGLGD